MQKGQRVKGKGQKPKSRALADVSFRDLDRETQYGIAIQARLAATAIMPAIPVRDNPGHFVSASDLIDFIVAKQPHATLDHAETARDDDAIQAAISKRSKKNVKRNQNRRG